jgi:hypothetical protein
MIRTQRPIQRKTWGMGPYAVLDYNLNLKVHKNENFFGFDFEFCTVSLLVMLKYQGFVKRHFD